MPFSWQKQGAAGLHPARRDYEQSCCAYKVTASLVAVLGIWLLLNENALLDAENTACIITARLYVLANRDTL